MSSLIAPPNVPVWVDYNRCKGCDICVEVCPSGTLAMKSNKSYVSGKIIEVINPDNCIGCNNCELSCPDFAIHVASKSEFKFAKLTQESKELAEKIKNNNYMML